MTKCASMPTCQSQTALTLINYLLSVQWVLKEHPAAQMYDNCFIFIFRASDVAARLLIVLAADKSKARETVIAFAAFSKC